MKNYYFIITVFIAGLILPRPSGGLTVQPSVIEWVLAAGARTNGSYLIRNDQNREITVNMEPESYAGAPVTNWFRPLDSKFKLKPGESRIAAYQITLPDDFKSEYIGKIFFMSAPAAGEEGGTSVITRMGSSFYVSSRDHTIIEASADDFFIQEKRMSVNLKNRGNVHLRFYFDMDFYNAGGGELGSTERVPLAVLLSGETKSVSVPFAPPAPLATGKFYAILNLYYGNSMPLTNRMRVLSGFEVKR